MIFETAVAPLEIEEEPSVPRDYVLARNFVLRMTGFPVELIRNMASPALASAIDKASLLRMQSLATAQTLLSSDAPISRSLRRRLKRGKTVQNVTAGENEITEPMLPGQAGELLREYNALCALIEERDRETRVLYEQELNRALGLLYQFATSEPFQQVLLLSSPEILRFTPVDPTPPAVRNSHVRQREFTWISYLQRLTTKNETISFFGPSAWGEFDAQEASAASIELAEELVDKRLVYVERWVCEALAGLISADPEAQPHLPFRLADDVTLQENQGVFLLNGKSVTLSPEERELALESTSTPIGNGPLTQSLLEKGILLRDIQLPIHPRPLEALRRQVEGWPDHPTKSRWSRRLQMIEDARTMLEQAGDLPSRKAALQDISHVLTEIGLDGQRKSQVLYASRLPVNEDCRASVKKLMLGKPMIEQLLEDAQPWYELWRDLAGLYATRLHDSLQRVWRTLGGSPVPLPLFLRACKDQGLPFGFGGGTGIVYELEKEIQEAWEKQIGDRWTEPVVSLTKADTAFLRSNFSFRRMKSFDNMAPDIQIIAPDTQSLCNENWRLLVAEIHPDFTNWQHCFFTWCPDSAEYSKDYAHAGGHEPAVVFGNYPPFYCSSHITLCIFPYSRDWSFVGVPGPEGVQPFRSAETMVDVTEDDILLLHNGRALGSLLNTWNVALNTHRVELRGERNHSPRLQVGKVIVQRESWTLQPDDEVRQAAERGGYDAFATFREFRKQHALPETFFVRGCMPQRLNFHKDVKPIFVDFRNPVLIEMLSKITSRFRRLSISEMLPALEDCWLEGPGGHYSCEFRTVVMATQESRIAMGQAKNIRSK
jgi:hypothetical protein